MTLEEFRATGRDVADLDAAPHSLGVEGPGRVYLYDGGPFINGTEADGFELFLQCDSYVEPLADLEARLFDWATAEGFFDQPADLHAAAMNSEVRL